MRYDHLERQAHCVFMLVYHVVFVTKFRKHCLSSAVLAELRCLFPGLASRIGVKIVEINGESDHIHLLLELSPQDTLGSVIRFLKSASTSALLRHHRFPYWGRLARTLWSSGYFACTAGGAPLDILKQYVETQGR